MSRAWQGKTVLVTGGASGIGRACAEAYAAAGASIAVADLAPTALPSSWLALSCDVARVDQCEAAVSETVRRLGRIDMLLNAAGVWVEGETATMREADWDRVIDINLKGTFFMCRFAIPHLEQVEGQIINIASDAGLIGNAGAAIYCASKGGVVLLTKALALELAPKGVRVNAICPCDVETPMLKFQAEKFGGGDPEAYVAKLRAGYPQGAKQRFATAQEIASFILAVSAPGLAPVTGAALSIDFGTTAGR